MDIHGVNEDEYLKRSNLPSLYARLKECDRTLSY